ncbi:MAG: helix-turn-helix domain-containing protein [Bacteroidia bacterium]
MKFIRKNALKYMNNQELAGIIKKRREELGISQKDLAEMSEIHLRSISKLESGESNPTLELLNQIAEILGLELNIKVKEIK